MTWTTLDNAAVDAASAAAILKRLKTIAWAVDGVFRVPGTRFRFGQNSVIGMLANIGVEAAAGAVPLLGNLFDMGFKANLCNIAIIEEHLGTAPSARRPF